MNSFVGSLPEDWYVSPEAAAEALRRRSMFNVIDTLSGMKVDLIVRKDRAFSTVEFQRRRPGPVLGSTAPVTSPEDTINQVLNRRLYAYQREWIEDESRFKLGLWARQTGKDFTCAAEAVADCLRFPGSQWLIMPAPNARPFNPWKK